MFVLLMKKPRGIFSGAAFFLLSMDTRLREDDGVEVRGEVGSCDRFSYSSLRCDSSPCCPQPCDYSTPISFSRLSALSTCFMFHSM